MIAALDGFTEMLIDIIKQNHLILKSEDGSENTPSPELITPLKTALLQIKKSSRTAQLCCKGTITDVDFLKISEAIRDNAQYFRIGDENKLLDIIAFMYFSMIGVNLVIKSLKAVKQKNRNLRKISAFEDLLSKGLVVTQFFDPGMDNIEAYKRAEFAAERWRIIFET